MYRAAARRTLESLGGSPSPITAALDAILRLRDTSLADCERLISDMLGRRDQWLPLFPIGQAPEEVWSEVRETLERPLAREHARVLGHARRLLASNPEIARDLFAMAQHACGNGKLNYTPLGGLTTLEQLDSLLHWHCVCDLLLTAKNTLRKQVSKREGFPATRNGRSNPEKERAHDLLERLRDIRGLAEALCAVRSLPPARYDDAEWTLVRHILTMLLHAVAELRVIFAERGEVDFAEIGMAARKALTEREVAGRWSEAVRHILVDEFQDTSRPQHELLTRLMSEWQAGDPARTCFVVGDPMQSIYLFRQAEVELFGEARAHGLAREDGTAFPLTPLTLQTNFRSTAAVVHALNRHLRPDVFAAGRSLG